MDQNSVLKRKKRFLILVRIFYLISLALIASGFFINYRETISNLGGQVADTDYNNINIGVEVDNPDAKDSIVDNDNSEDNQTLSKLEYPVPLTNAELDYYLKDLSSATKLPFEQLNDVFNQVDTFNQLQEYTVKDNKESLLSVLKHIFKDYSKEKGYPSNIALDVDSVNTILKDYPELSDLQAGQLISASFSDSGLLNFLSWQIDIKDTYFYYRENDRYSLYKNIKKTTSKVDVYNTTVKGDLISTLTKLGLSRADAIGANDILKWKMGRNIPNGAELQLYANFDFVDNIRYSNKPSYTRGIAVWYKGEPYFAIKASNIWYDSKGYRSEPQISFNRYPFNGRTPYITSGFNRYRRNPVTGRVSPHNGIDFGVPIGTPINSPADGRVARIAYQAGGAGHYLVIKHDKTYTTVYMHLSKIVVKDNQEVAKGQVIAYSGNSGRSTGPHLHYEIHVNNVPYNPKTVSLPTLDVANRSRDIRFLRDASWIMEQFRKYHKE